MVDITILLFAFLGGLISFISPCNAALLPTFLSYIGSSAKNGKHSLIMSIIFSIGYSTTFAITGILLNSIDGLIQKMKYFNLISGSLMVLMAFYLIFNKQLMSKKFQKLQKPSESSQMDNDIVEIDKLKDSTNEDAKSSEDHQLQSSKSSFSKFSGYGGSFLLGFSLGSAFIPCVTPMYASILTISFQYSYTIRLYLLLLYGLGLTLPFIILGLLMERITTRFIVKMIKYGSKIQKIFALFLLWIGIEIILTGFGYNGLLGII